MWRVLLVSVRTPLRTPVYFHRADMVPSNDTQEIDMEYLSKNASIVHQIIQTTEAATKGFDASSTPDSYQWHSAFNLPQDYHEYRFDWMPDRLEFFLDGMLTFIMREDIPTSPGHLLLSHWSNGNMGWSMGPPERDAKLTISYVKAYFNTTKSRLSRSECTDYQVSGAVCLVPERTSPPYTDSGYPDFLTIPYGSVRAATPTSSSQPNSTVLESMQGAPIRRSIWATCAFVAVGVVLHFARG